MIKNFDNFNEGLFSIDLKKIKESALEFSKTKEYHDILSSVDKKILIKSIEEVSKLKEKWGNIDNLSKKLITKAESNNESLVFTIFLSTFGIHFLFKLVKALKNKWGFWEFLGKLFYTDYTDLDEDNYNSEIRTFRDIIISVIFCIYLLIFTIRSSFYMDFPYKTSTDSYIQLSMKWDGTNNYKFEDYKGKTYNVIKTNNGKYDYDIIYNDVKIGYVDKDDNILNIDGDIILNDFSGKAKDGEKYKWVNNIDLEKVLTHKESPEEKKAREDVFLNQAKNVKSRLDQINKLKNEVDSINKKIYENVNLSKKILKENGYDYDTLDWVVTIKKKLTDNNNMGYMGLMTKLAIDCIKVQHIGSTLIIDRITSIYNKITKNKDIIKNLRDNNGNLKDVNDFDTYESINDALSRLESWKITNTFMRNFPQRQKSLIWINGWFVDDLKSQYQSLISSIVKISNSVDLKDRFLRKISSIKTQDDLINMLYKMTNESPWTFDYWIKKLNKTRNVYVTYSSKEDNQIICIVIDHSALRKIVSGTGWCIERDKDYFNRYSAKGLQCVLYDFNIDKNNNLSLIGFTVNSAFYITDCNDKSDRHTSLPKKFMNSDIKRRDNWHNNGFLKKEFINVNLSKAALKFDGIAIKILTNKISEFLNRPRIAKFIDLY